MAAHQCPSESDHDVRLERVSVIIGHLAQRGIDAAYERRIVHIGDGLGHDHEIRQPCKPSQCLVQTAVWRHESGYYHDFPR